MLNTTLSEPFPRISALLKVDIISLGSFQSAFFIIDKKFLKGALLPAFLIEKSSIDCLFIK